MADIAVNGIGRMGKLFLQAFLDAERSHDIVLLNKRGAAPDEFPLLVRFDTVQGRWDSRSISMAIFCPEDNPGSGFRSALLSTGYRLAKPERVLS